MSLNIIAYTDASLISKDNSGRGRVGVGIMGYTYENEGPGKPIYKRIPTVNGLLFPYEIGKTPTVTPLDFFEITKSDSTTLTNNHGEVEGAILAIKYAMSRKHTKTLKIYTDSTYVVSIIEKLQTDPSIEYTGKPNDHLWEELSLLLSKVGFIITVKHVRAHGNSLGNIIADKLANIARIESEKLKDNGSPKVRTNEWSTNKYVNSPTTRPKYMFMSNIYFMPEIMNPEPYYFISKPDNIGQPDSGIMYGLVIPKERVDDVDLFHRKLIDASSPVIRPSRVDLDALYNKFIFRLYSTYGENCITTIDNPKKTMVTVMAQKEDFINSIVATEIFPAGLSVGATAIFNTIHDTYTDAVNNKPNIFSKDITENIIKYEEKNGKCTGTMVVDNTKKFIKTILEVDGTSFPVILVFGVDIPPLNLFTKYKKMKTTIQLYYSKLSKSCIRTYIRVTNDEFDMFTENTFGQDIYFIPKKK